jgi:hypothetical protein
MLHEQIEERKPSLEQVAPQTVWVAAIVNADYDADIRVARTEAGLDRQIAQWCRDSWGSLKWHDEPAYPDPDTDEAVMDAVFWSENSRSWCDTYELPLED